MSEKAVVLVVADDKVIEEVDVEDVASLDEFGGYFFVGSAGFGVAGWVGQTRGSSRLGSGWPGAG